MASQYDKYSNEQLQFILDAKAVADMRGRPPAKRLDWELITTYFNEVFPAIDRERFLDRVWRENRENMIRKVGPESPVRFIWAFLAKHKPEKLEDNEMNYRNYEYPNTDCLYEALTMLNVEVDPNSPPAPTRAAWSGGMVQFLMDARAFNRRYTPIPYQDLMQLFFQTFGIVFGGIEMFREVHEVSETVLARDPTGVRQFTEFLRVRAPEFLGADVELPAPGEEDVAGSDRMYGREGSPRYELEFAKADVDRGLIHVDKDQPNPFLLRTMSTKRFSPLEYQTMRDVMAVKPLGTLEGVLQVLWENLKMRYDETQFQDYWTQNRDNIREQCPWAHPERFTKFGNWGIKDQKNSKDFGPEEFYQGGDETGCFYSTRPDVKAPENQDTN